MSEGRILLVITHAKRDGCTDYLPQQLREYVRSITPTVTKLGEFLQRLTDLREDRRRGQRNRG